MFGTEKECEPNVTDAKGPELKMKGHRQLLKSFEESYQPKETTRHAQKAPLHALRPLTAAVYNSWLHADSLHERSSATSILINPRQVPIPLPTVVHPASYTRASCGRSAPSYAHSLSQILLQHSKGRARPSPPLGWHRHCRASQFSRLSRDMIARQPLWSTACLAGPLHTAS